MQVTTTRAGIVKPAWEKWGRDSQIISTPEKGTWPINILIRPRPLPCFLTLLWFTCFQWPVLKKIEGHFARPIQFTK